MEDIKDKIIRIYAIKPLQRVDKLIHGTPRITGRPSQILRDIRNQPRELTWNDDLLTSVFLSHIDEKISAALRPHRSEPLEQLLTRADNVYDSNRNDQSASTSAVSSRPSKNRPLS